MNYLVKFICPSEIEYKFNDFFLKKKWSYFLHQNWQQNYRPVLILSIISKTCNLINKNKSGLDLSIQAKLFSSIIKKWLPNFYSGKLTGFLFIDLSKAIDTFNQHVLLHKLLSFGICNSTLNWFICYLTNRAHCFIWNRNESDKLSISIDLPQRSILWPLYFICYVHTD